MELYTGPHVYSTEHFRFRFIHLNGNGKYENCILLSNRPQIFAFNNEHCTEIEL